MIARSVACPLPVKASEPCGETRMRSPARGGGFPRNASARRSRKAPAAAIGPMVWDEDGPMPTLKMSKTMRNIVPMLADWQCPAGSQATFKRQVATAPARCKAPIHAGRARAGTSFPCDNRLA